MGSAIGLLLYCGYNFHRFGNPLNFGQAWSFGLTLIPKGLAGLLISPGFGLVWYLPCVVLALAGF